MASPNIAFFVLMCNRREGKLRYLVAMNERTQMGTVCCLSLRKNYLEVSLAISVGLVVWVLGKEANPNCCAY